MTWGSAAAALLWLIISFAFSWYVSGFGSYDKNYGALGAVIGFMTWIWLSAVVILLGAELNAEMEHQTPRHDDGHAEAHGAARRQDGGYRRRRRRMRARARSRARIRPSVRCSD